MEEGATAKAWFSWGWPSTPIDGMGLESIGADAMLWRSVNLAQADRAGAGHDTVVAVRVSEVESIVACRLI